MKKWEISDTVREYSEETALLIRWIDEMVGNGDYDTVNVPGEIEEWV